MAALGGVGSGAAAASGSAKTAPAASTVDALSMSRLESLLSRMFGPAACGLDATARLTASAALGIRRNAARHGEYRTGYHTRHHAADPKRTEPTGPAVRARRHHRRHRQGWQSIPGGCRVDRGIEERVAGRSAGIPFGSQSVLNPRTVMSLRAAAEVIECAVLLQRMSPVPTRPNLSDGRGPLLTQLGHCRTVTHNACD